MPVAPSFIHFLVSPFPQFHDGPIAYLPRSDRGAFVSKFSSLTTAPHFFDFWAI